MLHSSTALNQNPKQQPFPIKAPLQQPQFGAGETQCPVKEIHGICNSPAGSDPEDFLGLNKLAENEKMGPFLEQFNSQQHINNYRDGLEKPRSENEQPQQCGGDTNTNCLSPLLLTADSIGMPNEVIGHLGKRRKVKKFGFT